MNNAKRPIKSFTDDRTAITSIEYALVAFLIAIVCLLAVVSLGSNAEGLYTRMCNDVSKAISGVPAC